MLGRKNRFHGYGGLRKVYRHGQAARGSLIGLRYAHRQGERPYRVAVVVSRKVSKSAVTRNRIRRRIYEIVREVGKVPPATDLIFTVFSDQVASLEADQLEKLIKDLLKKTTD